MNRREALKLGAAAAGLIAASWAAAAEPKPLRVLIFGGTGFIGPHFVEALRAHGHRLTLFNRGKRNPNLFPDIETLLGDRNGQIDALKGREWDVVVDDSGYTPKHVKLTSDALKGRIQHYIFVSSISVYADLAAPGITEDHKVATLAPNANTDEITDLTYGALKGLAEQTIEQAFREHATIMRPSYIVGPGDGSDRFTYWPARAARGGEMLAPGSPRDPIQFIDVRDFAEFMRTCVEERFSGRYNVCNPPGAVTIGDLLETSKRLSGANTTFMWAPSEFLDKHQALESGEVPIWAPPAGELAGASLVSSARAVAQGLRFRPLETTVRDTLAWHAKRPAAQQQKLRAGFTPEREAELLKVLAANR